MRFLDFLCFRATGVKNNMFYGHVNVLQRDAKSDTILSAVELEDGRTRHYRKIKYSADSEYLDPSTHP
jgi:hypothetical protein